jgi:hypothetical protein
LSAISREESVEEFPEVLMIKVPMMPPITAPVRPIRIATKIPPAAGPGINFLATDPVTSPTTIHKRMFTAI